MSQPGPIVTELLDYFGYTYDIGADETLARENLFDLVRRVYPDQHLNFYPLRNYSVRVFDLHGYNRKSVGRVIGEIYTDMYVIYHGKGSGTLAKYVKNHSELLSDYQFIGSSGATAEKKIDGVGVRDRSAGRPPGGARLVSDRLFRPFALLNHSLDTSSF